MPCVVPVHAMLKAGACEHTSCKRVSYAAYILTHDGTLVHVFGHVLISLAGMVFALLNVSAPGSYTHVKAVYIL